MCSCPRPKELKLIKLFLFGIMEDDFIRYKVCVTRDNKLVIAVLDVSCATITNEHITGTYGKFRADCVMVKKFVDYETATKDLSLEIAYSLYDPQFTYVAGETKYAKDFDKNLLESCGRGIHYCKNVKAVKCQCIRPCVICTRFAVAHISKVCGSCRYSNDWFFCTDCWNPSYRLTRPCEVCKK